MSIEAAKKVCLRESAGGTVGWKLEGLSKRPDWLKMSFFLAYLVRFQRHALTVPNVLQIDDDDCASPHPHCCSSSYYIQAVILSLARSLFSYYAIRGVDCIGGALYQADGPLLAPSRKK